MEHWASAVLETITSHPKTPPSSPAVPPQAAASCPLSAYSLPGHQARTIDIEIGLASLKPSQDFRPNAFFHASSVASVVQRTHSTGTAASCSGTAKELACYETESTSVAQALSWRLYAALLAGVFQQCLSSGLIMTYGTILSYYATHLLRNASLAKLSLIGAVPPFVRHALCTKPPAA